MTQEEICATTLEERLSLAKDGATLPETLRCLYDHAIRRRVPGEKIEDETLVVHAVVSHPNTPPDLLAQLATIHPAEFCRNPAAALLALERPECIDRFNQISLPELLRRDDLPAPLALLIAWGANRPHVREETAHHIAVAGEIARNEVAKRVKDLLDAEAVRVWHDSTEEPRRTLRALIATGIAPRWLAEGGNASEVERHASAEERQHAFEEAITQPSPPLCLCLALAYRGTPGALLARYAAVSHTWFARFGVALNPRLSELPGVAANLAEDGNRYVRAAARARLRGEEVTL